MFHTNLREIDATLDVECVLDFIQAHGADVWLVNAGGILSFYPTDLPFQTRNPHLAQRPGGDLLGDAVHAAHAVAYICSRAWTFQKIPRALRPSIPSGCTGRQPANRRPML